MFLLSIILPLLSFLFCITVNRRFKDEYVCISSSIILIFSSICAFLSFLNLEINQDQAIVLSSWINSGSLSVDWSVQYNLLSSSMVLMVNFVSTLIHIYSIGYMVKDDRKVIFMGYLGLFTFFMLFLVSSSNLLQLFLGWEGVGLTSYLLIGFWYKKNQANVAAIKAFVVNRVGDFGLILALFATFIVFGTLNINEILLLLDSQNTTRVEFLGFQLHSITLIVVLIFIGCMGKSAQFGLHVWLPDAMEGPTPVSALIHAATMVTAGVFLLIILSPLIEESSQISRSIILIIGTITCIFASSVAIFQNDIKRIIAYSTCSQLGYMFMAIGVSAYSVAYFHLLSHAFFKALLFLGAGSVIHSMSDEQNIKKMGGLYNKIPLTYITMLIGSFSLMGLPFLSGYYSKDLIIEFIYLGQSNIKIYAYMISIVSVLFTTIYSVRLLIYVFHRENRSDEKVFAHIHESPLIMILPLTILSIFAIFFGMLMNSYFAGDSLFKVWGEFMFINNDINDEYTIGNVPNLVKKSPLFAIILGIFICYLIYFVFKDYSQALKKRLMILVNFFENKLYIDEIYNFIFVKTSFYLGKGFWKSIDTDLIDNLGPNGISRLVGSFGKVFSRFQSGYLYHYVLSVVVGLTLLLSIYIYIL